MPVYIYHLASMDSAIQKELNAVPPERRYQRMCVFFLSAIATVQTSFQHRSVRMDDSVHYAAVQFSAPRDTYSNHLRRDNHRSRKCFDRFDVDPTQSSL